MTFPTDAAASLHAAYAATQAQIDDIYRQAITGSAQQQDKNHRRAYLAALLASALALMAGLDRAAEDYASTVVSEQFARGAVKVDPQWEWDDATTELVHGLANDSYADLIAANDTARSAIRRVFSSLTRTELADPESRIAALMAAEQESVAGITRVLYSNGARFPLEAYVRMAVNTKLAIAYNYGILHTANAQGIGWVQVFDGPECGWVTHDDPDLADGTIRTLDDFWQYPIAHPNCVRMPIPRPDITTQQEAQDAQPVADQALVDAGVAPTPVDAGSVAPGRTTSRARRAGATASPGAAPTAMSQRRAARQVARRRRTQR